MLMTIVKGRLAIEQSIILIRLFKIMKDSWYVQPEQLLESRFKTIDSELQTHEQRLLTIENNMLMKNDLITFANSFNSLPPKSELTVCAGQIIEAQIAYGQIYQQATKSIFIIDNYVSLKTLAMLRNVDQNVASW